MGGYYTPTAGQVISVSSHNTYVRDQLVSKFATAAARDSAITAPDEGMYADLADTDALTRYSGSAWQTVARPLNFIRKTADESINLDASFRSDAVLVLPVLASAVYKGHLHLIYNSPAAAGFKVQISVPAGATLPSWSFIARAGGVTSYSAAINGGASGCDGTAADAAFDSWGLLVVGGTAGNAQIQWGQQTSNAGNTTVDAGSFFSLERVA